MLTIVGWRFVNISVNIFLRHTDRGDSTHLPAFGRKTRNWPQKPRGKAIVRFFSRFLAFSKLMGIILASTKLELTSV